MKAHPGTCRTHSPRCRILAVPVFAWALLAHPDQNGWRIATAAIFAAAIFTDFVDGYLARRYQIVTRFGKLADPIADKALTGMAFIGAVDHRRAVVVGDDRDPGPRVGITVLRFVVLRYGVMAANRGGKPRRCCSRSR